MKEQGSLGLLVQSHKVTVVVGGELIGKNDQVLTLELLQDGIFVLVSLEVRQVQVRCQLVAQVFGHLDTHSIIDVRDGLVNAR